MSTGENKLGKPIRTPYREEYTPYPVLKHLGPEVQPLKLYFRFNCLSIGGDGNFRNDVARELRWHLKRLVGKYE